MRPVATIEGPERAATRRAPPLGSANTLRASVARYRVYAFVLLHSPLVGPVTWYRVAAELRQRGIEPLTPAVKQDDDTPEPFWKRAAGHVLVAAHFRRRSVRVVEGVN